MAELPIEQRHRVTVCESIFMTDNDFKWASTNGGPLIAIESCNLLTWEGTNPPSAGRVVEAEFRWSGDADAAASDYDRACDCGSQISLIHVGHGHGLVLGITPNMTTWWPFDTGLGGVLVTWEYGELETDVAKLMAVMPELPAIGVTLEWTITDPIVYVFDSAYAGDEVLSGLSDDFITFELAPGHFMVSTSIYRQESVSLILNRIQPSKQ